MDSMFISEQNLKSHDLCDFPFDSSAFSEGTLLIVFAEILGYAGH